MIVSLAHLASDVANQIVRDTESSDTKIQLKALDMIHEYSKGLEKDFFGKMTETTKHRMIIYLRQIGTKISKDNVKIETKSDSKYP